MNTIERIAKGAGRRNDANVMVRYTSHSVKKWKAATAKLNQVTTKRALLVISPARSTHSMHVKLVQMEKVRPCTGVTANGKRNVQKSPAQKSMPHQLTICFDEKLVVKS